MVEESKKLNQDENDNDVPFLSEDEVSKDKTEEGFIPTRDELIVLVKYWFTKLLDSRWLFDFIHRTAGSDIEAERVFANRRINRIRKIVGDEKVDKACEEVRNDFRKGISDDLWAVFESGEVIARAESITGSEGETKGVITKVPEASATNPKARSGSSIITPSMAPEVLEGFSLFRKQPKYKDLREREAWIEFARSGPYSWIKKAQDLKAAKGNADKT